MALAVKSNVHIQGSNRKRIILLVLCKHQNTGHIIKDIYLYTYIVSTKLKCQLTVLSVDREMGERDRERLDAAGRLRY